METMSVVIAMYVAAFAPLLADLTVNSRSRLVRLAFIAFGVAGVIASIAYIFFAGSPTPS